MTRSKLAVAGALVLLTLAVGLVFIIEVRYEGASRLPWMPRNRPDRLRRRRCGGRLGSQGHAHRGRGSKANTPQRRVSDTSR